MKKRTTLRSLMIVIVIAAIGLGAIRIHRQYRADRVEFNRLVRDHKLAIRMKDSAISLAKDMRKVEKLERLEKSLTRKMRRSMERFDGFRRDPGESGPGPVFVGPLGALGRASGESRPGGSPEGLEETEGPTEQPDPIFRQFEANAEEWTRKEAAARAEIERFKQSHWWY